VATDTDTALVTFDADISAFDPMDFFFESADDLFIWDPTTVYDIVGNTLKLGRTAFSYDFGAGIHWRMTVAPSPVVTPENGDMT